MSVESVQAYVNWIRRSGGINSQAASQLNSITAQLNALNPDNPNSTTQLAALQRQAQAIVNSRDSQLAALGPPPNPANLTERERAQVGELVGLNAGNGLIDYRGALDSLQSAGAAAQRNIRTTQSAGTPRGQTTPVTTGNGTSTPVTSVAASANTTTRTSVTNTTNTTATVRANTTVTSNSVTTTTVTNTTNTTGGTRTVTTAAPQRSTANTADVQVVSTDAISPTTIVTAPITVDIPTFDRRGNVTGNTQVTLALEPITVDDEPIAVSVLADADTPLVVPGIDEAAIAELGASAAAQVEEMLAAQENPFQARNDWRVRLALSDDPSVNYLYKAPNPGILKPLNATNGVIFPYTPTISVNYSANYNPTELVHSNYKVFQYSSSSVDSINIQCDFTAQDEYEANYLLAVIHFFKSATKMFYGQDENPRRGTPPPLCYIYGMGSYQFAGQPLAIQQFSYNLPNNVDYITTSTGTGEPAPATDQPPRMAGTGVARGGVLPPPQFAPIADPGTVSWVPSKIQLSITCVPMMNRNAVSNDFSFEKYATGSLLNGVQSRSGGFW